MSTTADVVRDVSRLVDDLDALLKTQTAQQAPAIADELDVRPQFEAAVEDVQAVVDRIGAGVTVIQHAAVDADALVALLGIVPPVIAGIGGVVRGSGQTLADLGLGLGDLAAATNTLAKPIESVSSVLSVGVDTAEAIVSLTAPGELTRLVGSLHRLSADLVVLKTPPDPTTPTEAAPAEVT